jgi:hypothetical protein
MGSLYLSIDWHTEMVAGLDRIGAGKRPLNLNSWNATMELEET